MPLATCVVVSAPKGYEPARFAVFPQTTARDEPGGATRSGKLAPAAAYAYAYIYIVRDGAAELWSCLASGLLRISRTSLDVRSHPRESQPVVHLRSMLRAVMIAPGTDFTWRRQLCASCSVQLLFFGARRVTV